MPYYKKTEITEGSEERAEKFLRWYARSEGYIRKCARNYNFDVAQDTALKIYDFILTHDDRRIGSYIGYFLGAYRTEYLRYLKAQDQIVYTTPDEEMYIDGEARELEALELKARCLEFVRANYSDYVVSIYEIYVELHDEMSVKKMAEALGLRKDQINNVIARVRKDLRAHIAIFGP